MAQRHLSNWIAYARSLARRLIMQLFEQRSEWKRSDLVERLFAEHLALGNVLGTQDSLRVVKKALWIFARRRQAQN